MLSNRDMADGFYEDLKQTNAIEYFDVTYTVGRRKKKLDENGKVIMREKLDSNGNVMLSEEGKRFYEPGDLVTVRPGGTIFYAQWLDPTVAKDIVQTSQSEESDSDSDKEPLGATLDTHQQVTVIYNANIDTLGIDSSEQITMPDVTFVHNEGWVFQGWSPFPQGGIPEYEPVFQEAVKAREILMIGLDKQKSSVIIEK